jgi:hypothetical protein
MTFWKTLVAAAITVVLGFLFVAFSERGFNMEQTALYGLAAFIYLAFKMVFFFLQYFDEKNDHFYDAGITFLLVLLTLAWLSLLERLPNKAESIAIAHLLASGAVTGLISFVIGAGYSHIFKKT